MQHRSLINYKTSILSNSLPIKNFSGEKWKPVVFDFEFTNEYRLEVSSFGRLRTFNILSDGNIVNGSMVNGYRIIRLKLFRPRLPKTAAAIDKLQKKIALLKKEITVAAEKKVPKKEMKEMEVQLNELKKNLQKLLRSDAKERTINYHSLTHRLVASYFLKQPAAGKTIVAHLDFNKLNNQATNLKWMTPEENYEHQKKSPYVIEEKKLRKTRDSNSTNAAKLTTTKVMLIKKLLLQNKPARQLAKQFKVSDMQIIRIKRGENWGSIPTAT